MFVVSLLVVVVIIFGAAIANGWYFGGCDGTTSRCYVRHILGVRMSRNSTSAEEQEAITRGQTHEQETQSTQLPTIPAPSASTTPAPSPPDGEAGCTSGIYGHAVEVTIYGAPCSEWDRIASGSGEYWRTLAEPREERLICSVSNGGPLVEVRDEGGAVFGTQICARLTAKGWSESPGPGVEREHEQRSFSGQESG